MSDNPFSSPQVTDSRPKLPARLNGWQLGKLLLGAMLIGAGLGGVTNLINVNVYPTHFDQFLARNDLAISLFGKSLPLWIRTILWGLIEGSVYGFINGVIYIILIAIFSERRALVKTVWKYMFVAATLVFILVLLGGIWGLWAASQTTLDPLTELLFEGIPLTKGDYDIGWVFGSMRLAINLSPLCTITAAILYIRRHRYRSS